MDYEKIYYRLILKRRFNPLKKVRQTNVQYIYTEEHHIIPKSMGGTDEKINLVLLTAKEHFIAHLLLVKIYKNMRNKTGFFKMCKALSFFMCQSKDGQKRLDELGCKIHSRIFANLIQIGRKYSGKLTSKRLKQDQLGKKWITNGIKNHFLSPKDAEEFLKNNPTWRYGQKFCHRRVTAQAKANRLAGILKYVKLKKTKSDFNKLSNLVADK